LLLGCVVPRFLVWIGFLIFDPADRGYLNMGNLLATIVSAAFFTTLAFAIIERTGVKLMDYWNPRKLPPVKDPNRIPRTNSLFEIGALVVFFTFFLQVLWPGPVIDMFGAKIALAPAWRSFFWGFCDSGHVQSRIVGSESGSALLDAVPRLLALAPRCCWRSDVLLVAESATAFRNQRAQPVRGEGG
jgi:hypothetical protein